MSSNFYRQDDSVPVYECVGCLASHPYMYGECQAYLLETLNVDEYLDTTAGYLGHTKTHTRGFGAFSTDRNPALSCQSRKAFSPPDLATDTSYGSPTGLGEIQSMTIEPTSHHGYLSSSALAPDSRLSASTLEDVSHTPGPDLRYNIVPNDIYQSPISSSPSTGISETQYPAPQADRFRQFRCDHPSKRSPGTICSASFTQKKDLGRHVRSVHALGDESVYQCCCSYKSARKDNYMRHLCRCTKGHELHTFSCICGLACVQKMDHVAHLDRCGGRK